MVSRHSPVVDVDIQRIPFSTRINRDLIKSIKRIALEEDKELYSVVEEALKKWIEIKK